MLLGTIAACALFGHGNVRSAELRPPSSLKPEIREATVRVQHVHRVVQSCAANRGTSQCAAELRQADPRTELWILPLAERTLNSHADARAPVHVFIDRDGTTKAPLQLLPGNLAHCMDRLRSAPIRGRSWANRNHQARDDDGQVPAHTPKVLARHQEQGANGRRFHPLDGRHSQRRELNNARVSTNIPSLTPPVRVARIRS